MEIKDRLKAVELAVASIEKEYGKGAIMRWGAETPPAEIPTVSTGSLSLDLALGVGGLPRGRVVEIFGPEASGKTTLALHAVAEAQKAGGTAVFIDAEHALDVQYARRLGVDVDKLLISQPDTGEQALDIAEELVRSSTVDVIGDPGGRIPHLAHRPGARRGRDRALAPGGVPRCRQRTRGPVNPTPRFPHFTAFLCTTLFVVLLCAPMLAGRFLIGPDSDQFIGGYAFRVFWTDYVRAHGSIPQWNPYIFSGLPFVAATHGDTFHPIVLLRLLVPTDTAMNGSFLIHLVLAGFFAYLFLRGLGLPWVAATAGGIAYQLGTHTHRFQAAQDLDILAGVLLSGRLHSILPLHPNPAIRSLFRETIGRTDCDDF